MEKLSIRNTNAPERTGAESTEGLSQSNFPTGRRYIQGHKGMSQANDTSKEVSKDYHEFIQIEDYELESRLMSNEVRNNFQTMREHERIHEILVGAE